MTRGPGTHPTPARVRPAHLDWLEDRLTARDWRIIEAVNRLRLLTGAQIERLFFTDLHSGRSRIASRSRVLARLVSWRVLAPLGRRIGGAGRGSTSQCFALDSAGQRLLRRRLIAMDQPARVRRPGPPGERTVRHTLAASECYVALTELGQGHGFTITTYEVEPACWWPNGLGGYVKPDAYITLARGATRDHWWLELDLATESLPTVRRQLHSYLDFAGRGQVGPAHIIPRVVVATITTSRQAALSRLVKHLPSPADRLFYIVQTNEIALFLYQVLRE